MMASSRRLIPRSRNSAIASSDQCGSWAVPRDCAIKQAAAALGIGRTTLYTLIQAGELTAVKIRQRTLLRHDDLVALLDRTRPTNT
jgi:excisionase family DNA binding protein